MSTFEKELQSMIVQFNLYEVASNQSAALGVTPSDFLMAVAQAKCDSANTKNNPEGTPARAPSQVQNIVRDMYLLELMSWFKNDFFSWMDTPNCPHCAKPTVAIGHGHPTPEELAKSASRVEIFTCANCFRDNREVARFPRYNHPAILLKSRTGRCGEWANCFSLICRAAGFEIRHVRDWTDHVWVEVFSCSMVPNRWVHVDPCENSYDSPLLYDKGWGKKLSYVIAVSQDDIQDVTWRYVQESNARDVLSRRRLIEERRLVEVIMSLKKRLQANLNQSRKDVLNQRMVAEVVEFLYPRAKSEVKDSEMEGRESGSLAWRLARQELGSEDMTPKGVGYDSGHLWLIGKESISELNMYIMTYDSVKDEYLVIKNTSHEIRVGWKSGARLVENIFRKMEHDWKMVYLARKEQSGNAQGTISWQYNLSDPTLEIKSAKVLVAGATFNSSASILITLTDDKENMYKLVDTNKAEGLLVWNSDGAFQSCNSVTLTCRLQGGEGNTGWQHAQLFRQRLDSNSSSGLRVELEIVPKTV